MNVKLIDFGCRDLLRDNSHQDSCYWEKIDQIQLCCGDNVQTNSKEFTRGKKPQPRCASFFGEQPFRGYSEIIQGCQCFRRGISQGSSAMFNFLQLVLNIKPSSNGIS
ncbi:hypothetical protein DPEC_G00074430 [Dallia pectoralis]|uniref:Uncharacterized protein n=1 Tax=Dallia pectoralis TaxID=75939 RepID=A0ACC2H3M8_DALPE|nr:hypothetical protein DPEC_G00074430 [Dallia pectoralis]